MEKVVELASDNEVVIFSKSTCCLCYTVEVLFKDLGANALVHEIDQDPIGDEIERALVRMGCSGPLPAVFIGGSLVGSTKEIMSMHLSGTLTRLLKPCHPN